MDLAAIVVFIAEAGLVFAVSTFLFDALHYLLHRWVNSPLPLLRRFAGWHEAHHKFLNMELKIDAKWVRANMFLHVIPEYLTSIVGMVPFLLIFPIAPIAVVAGIRTLMFFQTAWQEGRDYNHMATDRVSGSPGLLWVDASYHARHHVYPDHFYSSFLNLFDLIFGRSCQIAGRRFLITGASGAFGAAMVQRLKKAGGIVTTAKSGVDFRAGDYAGMVKKLAAADVLVLAHGARHDDCWDANYQTFVDLIDLFIDGGKARLTPPEVWALGSEVELHGDMGIADLRDYAASKRAFAARARDYYLSEDVLYRHIVPSTFSSAMGPGPMSAATATAIAVFLVRRGFGYVPVTLTTLAFWNYFRFRFMARPPIDGLRKPEPAE